MVTSSASPLPSLVLTHGRKGVGEQFLVRRAVLFLVGASYFSAFASLQWQYPGLLGTNGVQPVDTFLRRVAVTTEGQGFGDRMSSLPTVLWLHPLLGLSVDGLAEWTCYGGALLSATSMGLALLTRGGGISAMWAALFLLYLSMFNVGQTFLSFQWDILLLEVGFLCIWLPPTISPNDRAKPNPLALWLLRFCMFKLMLMSGAVKVQANCPTWLGLTALRYHFATQPLPTPLAWYAHHFVPHELLKIGVAVTLAMEGPLTLLLLAPLRFARHFGAYCQIVLQVMIAATGNYTFFNLLTVALAVCHLDDAALTNFFSFQKTFQRARKDSEEKVDVGCMTRSDSASRDEDYAGASAADSAAVTAVDHDSLPANPAERRRQMEILKPKRRGVGGRDSERGDDHIAPPPMAHRVIPSAASVALILAALINAAVMFRIETLPTWSVSLAVGVAETNAWLEAVVPAVVSYFWMVLLPLAAAVHAYGEMKRSRSWPVAIVRVIGVAVALALSVAIFSITARPLASIMESRTSSAAFEAALPPVALGAVKDDAAVLRAASKLHVASGYGLFRRMTGVGRGLHQVARPEIVLEGSADGRRWDALEFRHKPGDPSKSPTWVAPHQPRLDWQMWFAALGSYQSNPWLLNLVVRLLQGHPEVLALMDQARWPGGAEQGGQGAWRLKFVRAVRYDYDFAPPRTGDGDADSNATWWRRRYTDEYLPALSLENESLKAYVTQQGWPWPGQYEGRRKTESHEDTGEAAWRRRLRGWPNAAAAAMLAGGALSLLVIAVDALAIRMLLEAFTTEVEVKSKVA